MQVNFSNDNFKPLSGAQPHPYPPLSRDCLRTEILLKPQRHKGTKKSVLKLFS